MQGLQICEHSRQRSRCKKCEGASIGEQNRQQARCKMLGCIDLSAQQAISQQDTESVQGMQCGVNLRAQQDPDLLQRLPMRAQKSAAKVQRLVRGIDL
eukprot:1306944-Rhodomonas_salina.2